MPSISEFFGIVIRMYYDDHYPAHFHAYYGEFEAIIEINKLTIVRGKLPPRVLSLVIEWSAKNQQALAEDWQLARNRMPLKSIAPLE